ncbi:MAG: hypothetical protein A2Z49_00440 [Chloroflexi bacterium RBG_19FT_COMBO_56_12]|nr:MAG: hypothetical protein A2Z49_00440 [Chloroflexi bacterium RBG_19FT_COMBO_56_12]
MAYAPGVDRGFFPLDEELKLLPGSLTPHGHECLVRLSSWMPFEKAVGLFGDFTGIDVSKGISQRYTEDAGKVYEQIQEKEVEEIEKTAPVAVKGSDKLQISADGAMVPLLHGVWAEARTVVIGEVYSSIEKNGESVAHTRNLSYFSRKVSAEAFQRLAIIEMHRRGVEHAKEIAAIMDGAEWEQGFTDYHCPHATRILDFPHAAEHVNGIGEALFGERTTESRAWLEEHLHRLKQDGPDELMREFGNLAQEKPDVEAITNNLTYLEKRREHMRYPAFQAQGWPIGSGIVESGNKLVVEARLKGSGMHWAEGNVNPMLALRNIICSDRWKEDWPKIEAGLRERAKVRQQKLHLARNPIPPPKDFWEIFAINPPAPNSVENDQKPKTPKPNPWRKFKHGKALYQRSTPAKN